MRLRKVDPPTRVIGSGAFRRIIFQMNPFLDFCGAWTERDGRAVFVETKSTSEPKLTVNTSGGLTVTQVESLRHWHNAGAVAFVLWEYRGEVALLPAAMIIEHVKQIVAGTAFKYIDRATVYPHWMVPKGLGFITFDFRQVMAAVWPR
jgi:hypothetical protein